MLVRLHTSVNDFIDFDREFSDIREILNYVKHNHSVELSDTLLYENHIFIGVSDTRSDYLTAETLATDLELYDSLYIVPVIEGEEPITATIALAASYAGGMVATGVGMLSASLGFGALSAGLATGIITTVATVVEMGIYMGVSMGISAILAPDNSFGGDPAAAQKSSKMFNSATIIREQGGSVPLTYGNPFCGGVLISSGLTSADVKA